MIQPANVIKAPIEVCNAMNITFYGSLIAFNLATFVLTTIQCVSKKSNPTLTRCSTKTIRRMFNFFHILKDQSFSY